jgi:hypothetical protein
MICLCDETPVIELAGGSISLDTAWLQQSLERAARAAGYATWWPAGDVARSVTLFLQTHRPSEPLSLEGFTDTVRDALRGIGYGEVAPHFLKDGLDLSLSLLDVAETTGPGFEIGFFRDCQEACRRLLSTGNTPRIALEDLEPAVKYILGKNHWSSRCQTFADELVAFLRYHLPRYTRQRSLFFSLR